MAGRIGQSDFVGHVWVRYGLSSAAEDDAVDVRIITQNTGRDLFDDFVLTTGSCLAPDRPVLLDEPVHAGREES